MIGSLRWFKYTVFFIVCLEFSSFCWADDRAKDRATLRGINAIIVRVRSYESGWSKELAKVALSESLLLATIEGQIEKAGITVVSEEASGKSNSEAFLVARIAFLDPEPAIKRYLATDEEQIERIDMKKKYVYAIRLNLRQAAMLQRDASLQCSAITWQTETVGFKRLSFLQDDVKRLVDVFIEAYLSENAQKKSAD